MAVQSLATLNASPISFTTKHWLIFATAGLGFAFDLYEMVVMAIVVRPVLMELGPFQPGTVQFNTYAGLLLFIPVVIGGLASLIGGYLTDRLGRQRVLVWSIVIYGVAAFFAGFSTSVAELMFWRSITVAGACVEFVAAIAWLTELFPDRRRREAMLGFAQACAAAGNFMIAGAYFAAVTWGDQLPAVYGAHSAWRYTLMFGALPAIPLMLARPFLPESPVWQAKKSAGTLRRPGFGQLFSPQLRRVTVVTNPNFAHARSVLANALMATGDLAGAEKQLRLRSSPDLFQAEVGYLAAKQGKRETALGEVARLEAMGRKGFGTGYAIAIIYTGLGDLDRGCEYLKRAVDDHSVMLGWMRLDPRMDSLRGRQCFADVEKRVYGDEASRTPRE